MDMMDKKKAMLKGLSAFSGWTIAKQAGSAVSEAVTAAGRVGNLAKAALFDRKKPCKETFADAVARFGLSDADLLAKAHEFQNRAALAFIVFVIGFAFFAASPMVSNVLSHAMLSAGVMLLGATNWLRWYFRTCQVRDRSLYDFSGWFVRDVWVHRIGMAAGIITILALALYASAARAAVADSATTLHLFTPPPGDASVTYLQEIFGPVVDMISAGGNTNSTQLDSLMGRMMVPFNSAVLFLGMIFVVYATVKGTVDSANDGVLLGNKMSSVWVPMRTIGGSALLLPLGSGYCLIQIGILWLAVQSAGIGNTILNAGLDYIAETNMVSRPNIPDSRSLAGNILKSEVCMIAMNKQYTDSGDTKRIVEDESKSLVVNTGEIGVGTAALVGAGLATGPVGAAAAGALTAYTAYKTTYRVTEFHWAAIDNNSPAYLNPNVCGAITWTESAESEAGNGNTNIAAASIMTAQGAAVRQMIADLRPLAQQIAAFKAGLPPGAVDAAATNYENTLMQAAKAAVQQSSDARRSEFIKAVRAGGWIFLPTYYNQMIQMNDVMQSALNALPATSPITIERQVVIDYALQNFRDAMSVTDEYLKAPAIPQLVASASAMLVANNYTKSGADAPKQELKRQFKQDSEFPTSWGDLKRLLSGFALKGIDDLTQQIAGSNLSHVGQIKAVGDTIIGSAETIATAMWVMNGAANSTAIKVTVSNLFDVGAALGSINPLLMSMVFSLLVFGSVAAFYIPLIPFIVGVTAVIKWFVLVFESVISAPIFAVAHIHPDGHDQVGKAGPGYMMILGLLMRPGLTVLGFFGSILLAQPVTGFVNMCYMTAVQGAQHESLSGIASFIAYVIIYVTIMTGVIHSVFALTNWVPDNCLRWIGGALQAHGIGDSEPKEAEHQFNAAVLAMSRGGGGGGGKPKRPDGDGNALAPESGETPASKNSANAEHLGSGV
jgi:conjugal transfer/type IV secretion protein DotA/TraY